jgi:HNH endonuclease
MVQYWWVNHKQTIRQEIEGQYLWSPKVEANGARSEFYNNMRRASPGDIVLSYADQKVRFLGRVAEFAFTAPKPEEFGTAGEYWNKEGWLLPVFWTPISQPVRHKLLINRLRRHLPDKYSPISRETGDGNQKAYLAAIPEDVFRLVTVGVTYDALALTTGGVNSLKYEVVVGLLEDEVERSVLSDLSLDETVRKAIVSARRGQGVFRKNLENIENACRLTGVTNPSLLIASHIKPWRACKSAEERLDGMNGLLLSPDADRLFDRGYITFLDRGEVTVSPRVDRNDLRRLGFEQLAFERFGFEEAPLMWGVGTFTPKQNEYLAYHRAEVFLP